MAKDKAKLAELLREAGLGEYVDSLMPYAEPCIRLHAHPTERPEALPLGASHIGGLPDLPPDTQWPIMNGHVCEFIAQIDLRDVAPYDPTGLLPEEGLLLFFFDGRYYEDPDADYERYQLGRDTVIYYTGDLALLKRATDCPESIEDWQRYRACTVTVDVDWMLPLWGTAASFQIEHDIFQHRPRHEPGSPAFEKYCHMGRQFEPNSDQDKHHMFGYAEPIIQDDPLIAFTDVWNRDEQRVNEVILSEWLLLLQISSDMEPGGTGMLWGDTSSLYYSIRKDDLAARRFENVVCVDQSC